MILFCFGTRPEWLKIKPILNILRREEYELLFTGQHPDLLKDVDVDYKLDMENIAMTLITMTTADNRLDQIISDCLMQFPNCNSKSVLVQGDTASAFACSLAAFNRGLKIYYLEAGLRSYNLKHPYPEEAYRQMIARISDVNFSPTELSKNNLEKELVNGKTYVTGNTVLDNLIDYKDWTDYTDKVLVTLHRRENHHWIDTWFTELEEIATNHKELEFILPIHPNPNVQQHKHILKNVKIVEPLSHDKLLRLLVKCKLVITDSGGLQEEGSFFNKKVIVCRETTERPEAIYTGHLHMCKNPYELHDIFENVNKNYYICNKCPYGDGHASERIVKLIYEHEKE